MNMPTSQNRSDFAFRCGFLRLATDSTAQSGFKFATYNWKKYQGVVKIPLKGRERLSGGAEYKYALCPFIGGFTNGQKTGV